MAARKYKGAWWVDFRWEGRRRIRKKSPVDNKRDAERYEQTLRGRLLDGLPLDGSDPRKEVPTFDEWFNGRFWREWVVGRKNKPSEAESKRSIYENHLKVPLGNKRLDEIRVGDIAAFRASLVEKRLADKTVNNILAVLSKPLRYAVDVEILARCPKVGLFLVEPPEIVFWELPEYARLLAAAKREGATVYAAVCLAGEGGLRVGEVKALRWREDVDMIARTITVNQQMRRGIIGTPKGRTRRSLPMTETLYQALRSLEAVREGFVIRNLVGSAKNDENQVKNLSYRICRKAGLPERGWHSLRHTFGTHAALFGVNPWRLMTWMGHKRIEQTLRYVHMAGSHMRELPPALLQAAASELDPDRRVLKLLGGRAAFGHLMGTGATSEEEGGQARAAR